MLTKTRIFGPSRPSKFALMGIRFIDGEDGGAPAAPPVAPEAPVAPTEPATPAKVETDWKAEARKWEDRAKTNSKAAEKLTEIEDAAKTAEQKLEERATNAEKALAASDLKAARSEVALEKGLTASQAKRLVGTTKDELTADADELLTDLGKVAPTAPKPDPSIGPKTPAKPSGLGASIAAFYDGK